MDVRKNSRRGFIKSSMVAGAAGMILASSSNLLSSTVLYSNTEEFVLPPLPYPYNALEPHIDKLTMEIHHGKHHQAYITNLNKAVKDNKITGSLEEILKNVSNYSLAVRNNAGGHWNHSFFWTILSPKKTEPSVQTLSVIEKEFGSLDKMKLLFNETALKCFGSGWAWLYVRDGKLEITSTPNQDNLLMDLPTFQREAPAKATPILALDVWEHAYYLNYQNKRADYINAFWNVVNWDQVDKNLMASVRGADKR